MSSLLSLNCTFVELLLHIISSWLSYCYVVLLFSVVSFFVSSFFRFLCILKLLSWFTGRIIVLLSLLLFYSVLLSRGLYMVVILKLFWGNIVVCGHILSKPFIWVMFLAYVFCWENYYVNCTKFLPCGCYCVARGFCHAVVIIDTPAVV